MTIFDLAPLSSWRKARHAFKALAKSDYFDTVRMQMAMEAQRLHCKRLEAENAELVAQNMALKEEIFQWMIGCNGEDRR